MAGESAREAIRMLNDEADRKLNEAARLKQEVASLKSEVNEEKRERNREVLVSGANPDSNQALFIAESEQEILAKEKRISDLESKIAELERGSNSDRAELKTLRQLARQAEAAEGRADEMAQRVMARLL